MGRGLDHADDESRQGPADAVVVEVCSVAGGLQAEKAPEDIVPCLAPAGSALRNERIETRSHLGARHNGRSTDGGL